MDFHSDLSIFIFIMWFIFVFKLDYSHSSRTSIKFGNKATTLLNHYVYDAIKLHSEMNAQFTRSLFI